MVVFACQRIYLVVECPVRTRSGRKVNKRFVIALAFNALRFRSYSDLGYRQAGQIFSLSNFLDIPYFFHLFKKIKSCGRGFRESGQTDDSCSDVRERVRQNTRGGREKGITRSLNSYIALYDIEICNHGKIRGSQWSFFSLDHR